MEFIRSDCFFCLLGDSSVFCRRQQFRRYRCGNDVCQSLGKRLVYLCRTLRLIRYKISYESLRNRAVNAIHGHVVTVICSPSKSELREVACTDYKTTLLVSDIHEDLRALSCLGILICNVMNINIMIDIPEVLDDSIGDRDLP